MAKTPEDTAADDAKKPSKKAPAKKAAAKKPAEKKAAPKKAAKPAAKKSAKKTPAAEVVEAPETIEVEVRGVSVIEDADIIAETPVHAAVDDDGDLPELTPEEQELQAIYGDDLAKPATAHAEYSDTKTADEDRPMLPEFI